MREFFEETLRLVREEKRQAAAGGGGGGGDGGGGPGRGGMLPFSSIIHIRLLIYRLT